MTQRLERPSSGRLDGKSSLPAGNAFAELFPPGRRTRLLRTEWNVDHVARPRGAVDPPEGARGIRKPLPGLPREEADPGPGTRPRSGRGLQEGAVHRLLQCADTARGHSLKLNYIDFFHPENEIHSPQPPATGRKHAITPFSRGEFQMTSGHLTGRLVRVH